MHAYVATLHSVTCLSLEPFRETDLNMQTNKPSSGTPVPGDRLHKGHKSLLLAPISVWQETGCISLLRLPPHNVLHFLVSYRMLVTQHSNGGNPIRSGPNRNILVNYAYLLTAFHSCNNNWELKALLITLDCIEQSNHTPRCS